MMESIFKHGSIWVRADFHLHTAAADEFSKKDVNPATYHRDFVNKLEAQGIGLAAITNHNKFDREEFIKLRDQAQERDMRLLAGVEFSAADGRRGIHLLIIFDDSWYEGDNYIGQFLQRAFHLKEDYDRKPYDVNSDWGLREVVAELDAFRKDYFLIMAHVDHKSGLLEELRGRNLDALVQSAEFNRRVLGLQKSASIEKRRELERMLGRPLALVEGSDNASLGMAGIGVCNGNDRKCYLKLGAFTFEAIKFALLHHEERVRADKPAAQAIHLRRVSIERGAEAAVEIPLNPGLNTIIGVRGGGKSSLLETIRFGLGLSPQHDHQGYKDDIARRLIGQGNKICLELQDTARSLAYAIERRWGEPERVLNEQGTARNGLKVESLINVAYFGQKDLEEEGRLFSGQIIEENLLKKQLAGRQDEVRKAQAAILQTLERIEKIKQHRGEQDRLVAKAAELEEAVRQFEASGLQGILAKELNFSKDESMLLRITAELEELAQRMEELIESYDFGAYLSYQSAEAENQAFFEALVFPTLRSVADSLSQMAQQSDASTERGWLDILSIAKAEFEKRHQSLLDEFAKAKQQIGDPDIDVERHKKNQRDLEANRLLLQELERQGERLREAHTLLDEQLAVLEAAREAMFSEIQEYLEKLNASQSSFQVEAVFQGDKDAFAEWLFANTQSNARRDKHILPIAQHYSNPIAIYRDLYRPDSPLHQFLSSGNLLARFRQSFEDALDRLLVYRVPDKYHFEYNGKDLQRYSIGQKATALIAFVLANEDKDLFLIDQPEDDLDNFTVAKEIIGRLVSLKPSTQFVFVTHNPNILVLGDSEQVVVCAYDDEQQQVQFVDIGSIDSPSIQEKTMQIMEGGKDAFARRKDIYELWKQ